MGERDKMPVAERMELFLRIKIEEWFWRFNSLLIYASFFCLCQVTFPYREILSSFGYCNVNCPYKEPLSFFGRFVQKVIVSRFSGSFFQKNKSKLKWQLQSYKWFSVFIQNNQKTVFLFLQKHMKNTLRKEICIARHDCRMCFLPKCRYRNITIGATKKLLQKLDAFCFNYQHVGCVYTYFKYQFGGRTVVKNGQFFDNVQRAVQFNYQHRGADRMPRIAKKRLLGKKYKKHLLSSFPKTKSTQIGASLFTDRNERVKRTKFELELIKIIDCFLDGHGNFTSTLVCFKTKSL